MQSSYQNPYCMNLKFMVVCALQVIRKTRDPRWNEEFQFMVDEAPVDDKIHIEVRSQRRGLPFHNKVNHACYLQSCRLQKLFFWWPPCPLKSISVNLSGITGACWHKSSGCCEQWSDQPAIPPHQLEKRDDTRRNQMEHCVILCTVSILLVDLYVVTLAPICFCSFWCLQRVVTSMNSADSRVACL